MVVYADILVVLNLIVDYFLLLITSKIVKQKISVGRMILGAVVGGLSSLYIFLPQYGFIVELVVRAFICFVMVLCTFGFKGRKTFFKDSFILFLVTCAYGGLMIAFWYIFKPNGMIINNSVVYFSISPLVLIGCTLAGYIIFNILYSLFRNTAKFAKKCFVTVFADDKSVTVEGIVDTGNSIEDVFCASDVIIVDDKCLKSLFGNYNIKENENIKRRYRLMPCSTVSGEGFLEGYRCDSAIIKDDEKTVELNKPVLALSKVMLNDDYSAIVNPEIFSK